MLSSNNRILSSRHRSCKNKKIIYEISSDEDNDSKKTKSSVKPSVKSQLHSNHRKKLFNNVKHLSSANCIDSKQSVISDKAFKASDTDSQSSSGSIKLTIKNKSKVILKLDCDNKKDSHKVVHSNQSVKVKSNSKSLDISKRTRDKNIVEKSIIRVHSEPVNTSIVKVESRPVDNFYIGLFSNQKDVQLPQTNNVIIKEEPKLPDVIEPPVIKFESEVENKQLPKKKLNLQEYKLRRECGNSNTSSRTVSPEAAIFPDILVSNNLDKSQTVPFKAEISSEEKLTTQESESLKEAPTKLFDPIREASRKILMNSQKLKARRDRYEDIVMTKIPKVESLELQPLMSEADIMKIVGNSGTPTESPVATLPVLTERPKSNDYEEIVLVSVGVNTDPEVFNSMKQSIINRDLKPKESSPSDNKAPINFKIRKTDNILKQNVFDFKKREVSPYRDSKRDSQKSPNKSTAKKMEIDKERYKDITATIKSVENKVDVKITSNSLFASIQDVVMKKTSDNHAYKSKVIEKKNKSHSYNERIDEARQVRRKINTVIVREYDPKIDHGEDKIILHLEKNRTKPQVNAIDIQTDRNAAYLDLAILNTQLNCEQNNVQDKDPLNKKSNDDVSNNHSDEKNNKSQSRIEPSSSKSERKSSEMRVEESRRRSAKRSRSRKRSNKYRYRSRSCHRRPRNHSSRNYSKSRSRSIERYRSRHSYRRSDSPYRRKKYSRSPYRPSSRRDSRSPSRRRDYRSRQRSRSRSKHVSRSRSPVTKKFKGNFDGKFVKSDNRDDKFHRNTESRSYTPPLRKPTISESSNFSVR